MSDLAADLAVLWVAATAACSALLAVVVLAQHVLDRVRHRAAALHRAAGDRWGDRARPGVGPGAPARR